MKTILVLTAVCLAGYGLYLNYEDKKKNCGCSGNSKKKTNLANLDNQVPQGTLTSPVVVTSNGDNLPEQVPDTLVTQFDSSRNGTVSPATTKIYTGVGAGSLDDAGFVLTTY